MERYFLIKLEPGQPNGLILLSASSDGEPEGGLSSPFQDSDLN